MADFWDQHQYPGYCFLVYDQWIARDNVPAPLLARYDGAFTAMRACENQTTVVAFLDAVDAIRERVSSILDGPLLEAALRADDLRKRAAAGWLARLRYRSVV